jgi:hypothetical protein
MAPLGKNVAEGPMRGTAKTAGCRPAASFLSIQVDFPVFAERTEESGSAGPINEIVCGSTAVLSVFASLANPAGRPAVRNRQRTPFTRSTRSGRLTLS